MWAVYRYRVKAAQRWAHIGERPRSCKGCKARCFPLATPDCRAQNPALRHEISFEMGQVHSDMALHFGDNQPVLSREDQVNPLETSSKASSQKPMWEKLSDALSSPRPSFS